MLKFRGFSHLIWDLIQYGFVWGFLSPLWQKENRCPPETGRRRQYVFHTEVKPTIRRLTRLWCFLSRGRFGNFKRWHYLTPVESDNQQLIIMTHYYAVIDFFEPILREVCSQGYPESAICVQRFDDSLNSAIRITYRISLRSSSLREPRYPLLTVVHCFAYLLWRLVSCLHKRARAEHVSQTLGVDKGVKKVIKMSWREDRANVTDASTPKSRSTLQ